MCFWDFDKKGKNIAFIENEYNFTYLELNRDIQKISKEWEADSKSLVFLLAKNTYSSICIYLSALQSKHTVCILPAEIPFDLLKNLIEKYQPEWISFPSDKQIPIFNQEQTYSIQLKDYHLQYRQPTSNTNYIFPDLAILLSTSGTTGSPKMVRLSYENICSNAGSIAEYLNLNEEQRPITTLPMSYSYGLSVINSHLTAGATIILNEESIISRAFWEKVKRYQATSMAGVPYTYQMLHKMGLKNKETYSLRKFTQAGGRLPEHLQQYFAEIFEEKNIELYIMYGQTEATARMSYLPPKRIKDKRGSIGIPIPGGNFHINEDEELVYRGRNVMLGYAENREELKLEDSQKGVLKTGDLATQDEEGYFFITGRIKRFIKLFGLRVNLDDVEDLLEKHFKKRFFCVGNDDLLVLLGEEKSLLELAKKEVTQHYKIHPSVIRTKWLDHIPILSSGKTDYTALKKLAELL